MKQFLSHHVIQGCERTVVDAIAQEWLTARVQNEDTTIGTRLIFAVPEYTAFFPIRDQLKGLIEARSLELKSGCSNRSIG